VLDFVQSFHPITILSRCLGVCLALCLALMLCWKIFSVIRADRGIILLIGIVKKIDHDIDFALDAPRMKASRRMRRFISLFVALRPFLMPTMASLLAGVPLAMERGRGRNCAASWHFDDRRIDVSQVADALIRPRDLSFGLKRLADR